MRVRRVGVVLAAVVVLGGCGGGGDSGAIALRTRAPEPPATAEQLEAALLRAADVGPGYAATDGEAYFQESPTRPGEAGYDEYDRMRFEPEKCSLPVDAQSMGGPSAARASREYRVREADEDGPDRELYAITVASAERSLLTVQFQAYLAALKTCDLFTRHSGNDSWAYRITDVTPDQYGPQTVGFRITYGVEDKIDSYIHGALIVSGETSVQVFAASKDKQPKEPRKLIEAQLTRLGLLAD